MLLKLYKLNDKSCIVILFVIVCTIITHLFSQVSDRMIDIRDYCDWVSYAVRRGIYVRKLEKWSVFYFSTIHNG